MLSPLLSDFPKSKIRRKPITTYKSPSANDTDPFITLSGCASSSTSARTLSSNDSFPQSMQSPGQSLWRKSRTRGYALPLYHPLGELALSLPPLNPADFGLPLPRLFDETSPKISVNSRRGSTKPPDVDEDVIVPTVSSIAAVAANEVKRASPRKRRGGNGKRRRREIDDGDATYPAKRTRHTRGGGGDDNDFEDGQGQGDGDGTPDIDGPAERRPERRSTRSRAKRRDSSEIDSIDEQAGQDVLSAADDNIRPTVLEEISRAANGEREGEISGDQ
ncbi:hypothetical protein AN958_04694 [Leucoagaricus sp. SymC.cos]|nr:hypothetical protein AN958_04694 [Leucoagaricus sp. SymC.cos]